MKKTLGRLLSTYLRVVPYRGGKKRLARWLGPYCQGVSLMTTYGFPIFTRFQDSTNRRCFEKRPDRVANFMQSIPEGAAVLDIGANQGAMAILAQRVVGMEGIVLAFEPCAETAARLHANRDLNAADNLVVFQRGIGCQRETLSVGSSDPLHSGAARIGGGEEQVIVSPLFDIPDIESYLGSRPIYGKIDTEGYELEVLRGLEPLLEHGRIRQVIVEIDDVNLGKFGADTATLYYLMEGYGYVPRYGPFEGHYDEVFTSEVKLDD